jgi:hypothetical protein
VRCYRLDSAIASVCDMPDNEIRVNGRTWRFDFDRQLGPTWLRKDGTERKCQMPNKQVWAAFEKWLQEVAA